ncbi:PREDICTED: uncharacterized protein LOC106903905 [Poecilia mexicana]|uniref:uncharacterized protein LOC106903905 n=1 Tax=Poecilia mexicana TaxID=48701 RepID=UPI00072DB87A|nr:PREDICTED: uncharacterized protein LOC106903905 [Poecilia mexicana]
MNIISIKRDTFPARRSSGLFPLVFRQIMVSFGVSLANASDSLYVLCQLSVGSSVIFGLYTVFVIFILGPLFALILFLGFQRWRRQRSSPAATAMSSTDFFTYNMMAMELFGVVGTVVYTIGQLFTGEPALMLGVVFSALPMDGLVLFHLLTCLERYLAVVHPIAYMHVRDAVRVRIRNISSAVVWLLSCSGMVMAWQYYPDYPLVPMFSLLGVAIFGMLLCCVLVLRALVRPGPGQEGGKKQNIDQSKKRAFQMIMAITGALILRSVGLLFWLGLVDFETTDRQGLCIFIDLGIWLTAPSSLVLPFLFLHRAGKLSCGKQTNESG